MVRDTCSSSFKYYALALQSASLRGNETPYENQTCGCVSTLRRHLTPSFDLQPRTSARLADVPSTRWKNAPLVTSSSRLPFSSYTRRGLLFSSFTMYFVLSLSSNVPLGFLDILTYAGIELQINGPQEDQRGIQRRELLDPYAKLRVQSTRSTWVVQR